MPSIKRAVQRCCSGLLIAAAALCGTAAQAASVLSYTGDFNGVATGDALQNATNLASTFNGGVLYNAFVYDDFVVPTGQVWVITNVFSNIQSNVAAASTTATWQILSGVSAGNGGTTVAHGDGAATETATGGAAFPNLTAYHLSENISPVVLTAGTYWLTVAPDIPSPFFFDNFAGISSTSGSNAIGNPPDNGNSFITTTVLPPGGGGYFFTPTSVVEGGGTWDWSMGVAGTVVPEPSTFMLGGVALCMCGLSVAGRRLIARAQGRFGPKL